MLINALAFVMVFGVMVLVHELGHYVVGRRAGIKVEEFGFGYPPRIATLAVRGGVEYTLNALPLGGFVRFSGETDPNVPGGFATQSAWARISTLLAGPIMNLVLAGVLLVVTSVLGDQIPLGKVVVQSVAVNSPAGLAGMQAGDLIVSIQGMSVRNTGELMTETQAYLGREVTLELERAGQRLSVKLTPRAQPPQGEGAMGVVISMQEGYVMQTVRHPLGTAIALGLRELWSLLGLTFSGFLAIFRVGLQPDTVTGPVGIFQMSGAVARTGLVNLMRFTALLSINLFIVNLFPLPVLDGGQVALVLLEKLRGGRPLTERYTQLVSGVSWLLLGALVILITYMDIVRISSGGSLLP